MVQAAGRAGRAELPGRVLIQCSRINDPTIQSALAQDFASFSSRELSRRRAAGFPPYTRMALIEICSSDKDSLIAFTTRVSKWFEMLATMHPELTKLVKVLGPVRPPIEQLRSRFRRSMIVSSPQVAALQHVVGQFHQAFLKTEGDIRVKIDVDPQQVV